MDEVEVEKRKKRLEDLKQQSLELEKEAAERERRNEERKKQREESARLALEQEKKEEEERQKKRDERRRLREEEEKQFNAEMARLETEKLNRRAGNSASSTPSPPSSISSSTSTSSLNLDEDPEVKKQQEEREKRNEERRKQREQQQKEIELEEKRLADEREKRRLERKQQMEKDSKSIQDVVVAAKTSSNNLSAFLPSKDKSKKEDEDRLAKEKLESDRLAKEKADKAELDRVEKEKTDKLEADRIAKEKSDKEEQERLAKAEKERLEKIESDRLEKEKADKEEQEKLAKIEADRIAKEKIESDRIAKEKSDKEEKERLEKVEADRIAKENADKEEQERLAKIEADRITKEKVDKEEQERLAKIEADRIAKEKSDKEEQERLAKIEADRIAKEKSDKEEQERLAKIEADRIAKEKSDKEQERLAKIEADRIAKEKADKEEQERLAKIEADRIAKEKADKEEQEKLAKIESDRIAKEKADKEEKERLAKIEADRIAKEKSDKEEKERLAKIEADRITKEKADKEEKERLAKIESDRIAKEKSDKEEKERLAKIESDRIAKENSEKVQQEKISNSTKITDNFKLSIEKQLQSQLAGKLSEQSQQQQEASTTTSSHGHLTNLTLDRPKMKTGRKLPSKNFKTPGSTTTSTSIKADENSNNNNSGSILSQALETATTSESKKKIVLPPGAGGILGSMASLAMEAQKKKLEKDNKLLSSVINQDPDAPVFVKGRSQSVSVTSTLKDNTGKFLNHKKTVDTYSGQRVRLIQCKGKKRILSKEVEVSIQSLNKMDSFVLDCGIDGSNVGGESADSSAHSTIYIFYGSKSTANKKSKAVGIAEIIKSHERGGHATIIKLDEGDNDERFYKLLKGTPSTPINPDGGDDLEAETHWAQSFTLSKYETSTQTFSLIDTKSLSMELLASDSYFVLDTVTEFYEWSGRNVDINLKDTFHQKAQEKLKSSKHRQAWVESVVLSEGGETVLFREKFFDWPDLSHEVSLNRMGFGKKKAFAVAIPYEKKSPAKMNNFEAREMISLERAEEVMKSDGKGEYEIWYLDQMKMYPLPKEEYGQFYSGCCYIIRYTYTKWNALKYIIYYWQGVDASRQDVGSSSLLVKDLYIETCNRGECTQEPERQGRESSHFLYVFNGRMVVHRGARGEFDFTSKRLYHVFGRTNETITAVQCTKVSTTQLNSRDCFILNDKQQTYLWESKGASKALKEQSNQLISQFFQKSGSSLKLVKEGQEPEEFWKLLGATTQQHKYANYQYLFEKPLTDFSKQIRLYAVINTGTIIRADEIFRFSQYDLQPSKVFILDNQVNVFIWSGSRSQEKEKKRGAEIAIDYIKLLEDGRSESDVLFITEKEEPLSFTCFFHSWDTFRFQSANGADEVDDLLSPKIEAATNFLKKYYQIVPYDQLTQKNTPPEIDRSVLEMYLSDEEFEKHLGMTKQEWESFPSWKKSEKKKSANLF